MYFGQEMTTGLFDWRAMLGDIGFDPRLGPSIAIATANPTYQNIRAVESTAARYGVAPNARLMSFLWGKYYENRAVALPGELASAASYWPIALVILAVILLSRR